MNTLFIGSQSWDAELLGYILEGIEASNLYIVTGDTYREEYFKRDYCEIIRAVFSFDKVSLAEYSEYLFYKDLMPLDEPILESMSRYDADVLKMLERHLCLYESTEMRFIHYYEHIRYWNSFLDLAEIRCVVFADAVPHAGFDYVLMRLCELKKILIVQSDTIMFSTHLRRFVVNSYENIDYRIVKRINELNNKTDLIELPNDLEEEYRVNVGRDNNFFNPRIDIGRSSMISRAKNYINRIKESNKGEGIEWIMVGKREAYRKKRMLREYETIAVLPDYKEKYVFFTLQYQPELTTSPLGGWFVHQFLAIDMLAACLPDDVKIYVKEHPSLLDKGFVSRERFDYARILKNKNVELIKLSVNSVELIKNSVAVACVTGSIGYEAMYKHKPLIIFGDYFMKYGPWTFNVRTNRECEIAIDTIINGDMSFEDRKIRAYLSAVGAFSYNEKERLVDKSSYLRLIANDIIQMIIKQS